MENLNIKLTDLEKGNISYLLAWKEAALITLIALEDVKNLSKMDLVEYGLNSTLIHEMKKANLINYSVKEDKLSLTDIGKYVITKLERVGKRK